MDVVKQLSMATWEHQFAAELQNEATQWVEDGRLLFFPQLAFTLKENELGFLSPDYLLSGVKNISLDNKTCTVRGFLGTKSEHEQITMLISRFAIQAQGFVKNLFPHYQDEIQLGRTSFRPARISDRKLSYRKDDRLLHVDAFPANPNQGKRILRVFSNINLEGEARVWHIGEPFEKVAKHFLPKIPRPWLGSSLLLKALKITKSVRTEYDHIMLQIHDRMKFDKNYQHTVEKTQIHFPAQSSWIVKTDQVSHAALSGQHMLEQTFYLPVAAMMSPEKSPLKILEQLTKRRLVSFTSLEAPAADLQTLSQCRSPSKG